MFVGCRTNATTTWKVLDIAQREPARAALIGSQQENEVLLEERLRFQRRRCSQGAESQINFAAFHILK